MDLNEFKAARTKVTSSAIERINAYTSPFRGFDHLNPVQKAAVADENQAHRILARQDKLEKFVGELVEEMLPDSLAEGLSAETKPVAIFIPGALGANAKLFKRIVLGSYANNDIEAIIKPYSGRLFIKNFDEFYARLYAKLEAEEVGHYSAPNRDVSFPGVRAFSGVIEAVRVAVEKDLHCSYIGHDNVDAHPVIDTDTAEKCSAELASTKKTHKLQIIGYALSPQEAVKINDGKYENTQVEKSAKGFAAYFAANSLDLDDAVLINKSGKTVFKKIDGEVYLMDNEYASWLNSCGVEPGQKINRAVNAGLAPTG